eukprot:IDg18572t1
MIKCYGKGLLNRIPSPLELRAIKRRYAARNFPGCIGALDWRPCTSNDIVVAENSPLIMSILRDGIYLEWSIFVKPKHVPTSAKEQSMTKDQDGTRKVVDRLFGVLQS